MQRNLMMKRDEIDDSAGKISSDIYKNNDKKREQE